MYHVEITQDGKTLQNSDFDGMIVVFTKEGECGIHAESIFNCTERSVFELLVSLDQMKERILKNDSMLKMLYINKDFIIGDTTVIDVTALRKGTE